MQHLHFWKYAITISLMPSRVEVNKWIGRQTLIHRGHNSTESSGHGHVPARMQTQSRPNTHTQIQLHSHASQCKCINNEPSFLLCYSMDSPSCPHLKVEIIVPISTLKFPLGETRFYVASWWLSSCLSVPIHTNTSWLFSSTLTQAYMRAYKHKRSQTRMHAHRAIPLSRTRTIF